RHFSSLAHHPQNLPISQSIHGTPEALIFVGHEVTSFDQAIKRFENQFLAIPDVVEYLFAKDEIAAVYPYFTLLARAKTTDNVFSVKFGQMKIEWRVDGNEAADFVA